MGKSKSKQGKAPKTPHKCPVELTRNEAKFLSSLCHEAKVTVKEAGQVVSLIHRLDTYANSNSA